MTNEMDTKQELREWISENPLEDADDLVAFVQDASLLAALGDNVGTQQFPEIFSRPKYAENFSEILKTRCELGIWEAEHYTGEALALSLLDAQDFYCFARRFPERFDEKVRVSSGANIELRKFFKCWWDACEHAELDNDAAEMLEEFLRVYPIPEDERLPVVDTPIADWEYALLDKIYAGVELPIINARWNMGDVWLQPLGKRDVPAITSPLPPVLACDDDTPPVPTKKHIESSTRDIETSLGTFRISRFLDDDWKLQITIAALSGEPVPISRIHIRGVPAFRDDKKSTRWNIDMKWFDPKKRRYLLDAPLIVQLSDGITVRCF
jgi:hypothetical protein